jgi:hypothetical protein
MNVVLEKFASPYNPREVLLGGIAYHVEHKEDMVTFSASPGVYGCYTRMSFERRAGCWYVSLIASAEAVMVSHITEAYRMVCEAFGGNHQFTDEYRP